MWKWNWQGQEQLSQGGLILEIVWSGTVCLCRSGLAVAAVTMVTAWLAVLAAVCCCVDAPASGVLVVTEHDCG